MHSLENELREVGAAGALSGEAVAYAIAVERGSLFSLYLELRAALYGGVALVVSGVGILIARHLDRIGPLTLISVLALAAAGCYVPAIRARSRGTASSTAAQYLLLLGALLVSADLGYAESQFHWLGSNWSRHLLILAALHAFTAYWLGSPLVLSVALTSLAGWFGIERGAGNPLAWHFSAPATGWRALLCAALVLGWRELDVRLHAGRFRDVFAHFATNLAFWGALGWCSDPGLRLAGLLVLLVLAALSVRTALRSGSEVFAVYGVGYAALGLGIIVAQLVQLELLGATLVLAIVLTAAAVLRYLHDVLKDAPE